MIGKYIRIVKPDRDYVFCAEDFPSRYDIGFEGLIVGEGDDFVSVDINGYVYDVKKTHIVII
jgi:hypothetical protein